MKNLFRFAPILLLIIALFAGIYLTSNNQNTQKGAAASAASSTALPSTVSTNSGDNFTVALWVNTGSATDKLAGAEIEVPYNSALVSFVNAEGQNGYTLLNENVNGNAMLTIKMVTLGAEKSGSFELIKLNFKAISSGTFNIAAQNLKLMITGQSALWSVASNTPSVVTVSGGSGAVSYSSKMLPASISIASGDNVSTEVWMNSGTDTNKLSGAEFEIAYNSSVVSYVGVEPQNGYTVLNENINGNGKLTFKMVTLGAEKSGLVNLLKINFKAVSQGSQSLVLSNAKIMVSNESAAQSVNANSASVVTVGSGASSSVINGSDYVLNYKVSLSGINATSSKCVGNPPLKITVVGDGQSKTYEGVVPSTKDVVDGNLVFGGSLNLTGFAATSGVAAFISGPKHLQMKYGINNQTDIYSKANGELTLTKSNTPVYDFSKYPILAGDDNLDGLINGVDYAYIKSKALIHETVSEGIVLKGDLNMDCQVNSGDVNMIKMALQDKQGQLY